MTKDFVGGGGCQATSLCVEWNSFKRHLTIMAHLLGSKTCIDSLRIDIEDLENVIHEIVGKTGSLKCHSWKFPDKLATDLDLHELLQRYQHGKNDLDNQVAHIVLFELIIDRLLLVLHGSWRYIHEVQTSILPQTNDVSMNFNQPTSLSVGLVVKKYWNKMIQFSSSLQQNEKKRPNLPTVRTAPVQRVKEKSPTSSEICCSCSKIQQNLDDQIENLVQLCHTYNLPSSLAQFRSAKSEKKFSMEEINHFSDCQSKDLDRLSKHLEYLNNDLNKSKSELELTENRLKKQEETNRRLQQLINDEKQAKKLVQQSHEEKLSKLRIEAENQEKQIQLFNEEKLFLTKQIEQIELSCRNRDEQIENLKKSKIQLEQIVEEKFKAEQVFKSLEQDRIRLETELDLVKRELDEKNRDLNKERTRIENFIRQEQSVQNKQKTISESYEALLQETESLKKQLNDAEVSRDELERELHDVQKNHQTSLVSHKENETMKNEIENLRKTIEQMEQREQLLVQYPDLNGPIEHQQTTQNLIVDMQNQIRTNEIRIDLLRKQNQSLKSSLEKLTLVQQTSIPNNITEERYEELRNRNRRFSSGAESTTTTTVRKTSICSTDQIKTKVTPLWSLNHELVEQQAFTESRPPLPPSQTFVPRFSENDYVANGWIKSESDVISLPSTNNETKPVDRTVSRNSYRASPSDLIVTVESRPATVISSSRSNVNGRTSTLPPPSDYEMIIGKGRTTNRPSSASKTRNHSANDSARRDQSHTKTSKLNTSGKLNDAVSHQCTNCQKTYDDKRNFDIHKLYCRNKS